MHDALVRFHRNPKRRHPTFAENIKTPPKNAQLIRHDTTSHALQFRYTHQYILANIHGDRIGGSRKMRAWSISGLAALLLVALQPGIALAKPNPSVSSREDGIMVSATADDGHSIDIAAMSIRMKIHGHMAETVMDVTLANTSDDEVEAHFALELPTNAVVTGYALDIDGQMIDGVLVDQPKAKAVYEDEIRQGIDPGLAEIAPGNVFRTRVYPVDAGKVRKIRLRFSAPVDLAGGLIVPLESDAAIGDMTISVEVDGVKAPPVIELPFTGKLALARKGTQWAGTAKASAKAKLTGMLRVSAAVPSDDMLISEHENGSSFFQIADADLRKKAKADPVQRIRVYWDSSLSRRDDLLDEEIALVKEVATRTTSPNIDIVRFSAAAPVTNSVATSDAAAEILKATVYRGGTSFRGLDDINLPDADLCMLFSDGVATIQADSDFRPDCRLMIVTSTREANSLRLGMVARASRGQLLKLDKDNRQKIAEQLLKPAVAVVAARRDDGRKLPFRALSAPDGSWLVVGKAPDSGDVHLTIAGLGKGISRRIYPITNNGFAKSNAAGALWAAEELERLSDNPLKREIMRDMAEDFNVASSTMSLLVLDEPGQYLRADIKPPKGFGEEWMMDYREQKKELDAEAAEAKAERLNDVRERWAERKIWWNAVFNPPKRVKERNEAEEAPAEAAAESAVQVELAPQQQEPGYVSDADAEDGMDVIVTGTRIGSTRDVALSVNAIGTDEDGNPVKLEIADVLADQPYLKALDQASVDQRMAVFAEQENAYGALPAFYLDTAEWFRLKGDQATSDALLLSALELPVADDETRLIVAFRLQRAGQLDEAIHMLELIEVRTENRPQPKRSLALALISRGKARGAAGLVDLERAFKLLVDVALNPGKDGYSGGDFDGIETVALMEANPLIPLIEQYGGHWELDNKLLGTFDTDVRIIIEWTNDDADIDLWVIEPTGEKTFYGNRKSKAGGAITNDMTNGYGPEEYVLRRAIAGEYKVKIDGYSPDRLNPNGKGRVMVRLIRDFARKTEREELVDAELSFDDHDGSEENSDGAKLVAKLTVDKDRR
ncbi:MAG: VIT domain-containing protein [Sphingomonadaceae bacterium]